MAKKIYRTSGVAPPDTTEVYQDEDGKLMRDNGATWDSSKRAWKRTLWRMGDDKYMVTYSDGSQRLCDICPEITPEGEKPQVPEGGEESEEPYPVSAEEIPASWELQNQYVSSADRPDWDEYFTREIIGIEPVVAPLPQEREQGGDWLQRRARKVPKISSVATLR